MDPVAFWSAPKTTSLTRTLETSQTSAVPSHDVGWVQDHRSVCTHIHSSSDINWQTEHRIVYESRKVYVTMITGTILPFFPPVCNFWIFFSSLSHRMTLMTQSVAWYLSAPPRTKQRPCSFSWLRPNKVTSLKSHWKQMRKWWGQAVELFIYLFFNDL